MTTLLCLPWQLMSWAVSRALGDPFANVYAQRWFALVDDVEGA